MNSQSLCLPDIIQSLLLVSRKPLSIQKIQALLAAEEPEADEIREAQEELRLQLANGPLLVVRVTSGYRLQVCSRFTPYIARL